MFKVPIQNLCGAALLLTLALSVNDGSSVPGQDDGARKVQLACNDGDSSGNLGVPHTRQDTSPCREIDFP